MIRVSGQSKGRPVKAAGGCGGRCSAETSKIARRCGEKRILKSKCTKHLMVGALYEVSMSKNWAPLWREAHFEVKMYKTPHGRSMRFMKFRCRKLARPCGEKHILKAKCTKHFMVGACAL